MPFSSRLAVVAILFCSGLAFAAAPGEPPYRLGTDESGRYWFFDAQEKPFLSLGVNTVLACHDWNAPAGSVFYDPIPTVFGGSFQKWQESVVGVLRGAGFNTIGAWSTPELNDGTLFDTPILYVASHEKLRMIDAILPGFEEKVRKNTREALLPFKHPANRLGVFLDNEMAWYGLSPWDDNPRHTILEEGA